MTKSLVPFFFQTNLSIAFPLVSLVVFVLSIFLLLEKTSFQPKPQSVSLDYSRLQQGYRCYSPDTHRYFISADVTFFDNSSMFSINHPLNSDVISLTFLYSVPDTSPVPPATPPQPLQVYTCCPRIDTEPPADSSPTAFSSTMSVLQSPANLHIVIQKDTRSSHNPHPIYNFLIYHRLSSSYSTFVSTLSSVSVPQIVHEALSHSDWK